MSKFIKLTNILLNTNHIHKIVIDPRKYHIHMVSKNIDANFNWHIGIMGFGKICSNPEIFEVCEIKHTKDYKIVSDWINKK